MSQTQLRYDHSNSQVGILFLIIYLMFLYLSIASVTWLVRNPTANYMTTWTRLSRVVRFEKLAEYQVVKTYKSIGR